MDTHASAAPAMLAAPPLGLSVHPANLGLRFALELAALAALGWTAASLVGGALGVLAAAAVVLVAAAAWGTFAVLGDPTRSGRAPVPVSGRLRILVESAVLVPGVVGLAVLGHPVLAGVFAAGLVTNTALSTRRLKWLWHVPRRPASG